MTEPAKTEEPESKVGLVLGGAMLLGLAAYAFAGGRDTGGYLDSWKKDQEAERQSEAASEEIEADDDDAADDAPASDAEESPAEEEGPEDA